MTSSHSSSPATRIVIVDDVDQSIDLSPLRTWGWSNQGQGVTGRSFSFSNTENATATFRFPQNATAFFWRGFLRSGPALYSVCIDCTDLAKAEIVDGHTCQRQSTDVVTTLFSKAGLTNSGHTITITNLLDPRFGAASQITIDSFILVTPLASTSVVSTSISSEIAHSTTPSTTINTPSVTSSVATPMISDGTSPATAAYWSKPKTATALSTSAIVGAAFAGASALLIVLVLSWWLLWKRNLYRRLSNVAYGEKNFVPDPESPMFTGKLPPLDSRQASMAQARIPSREIGLQPPPEAYRSEHPPGNHPLGVHNSNIPPNNFPQHSHSNTGHPTSLKQWGIIPVRLCPGTNAGKDMNADSDFDFNTPYPSSEIGTSSFTITEYTHTSVPLGSGRQHDIENQAQALPKNEPCGHRT